MKAELKNGIIHLTSETEAEKVELLAISKNRILIINGSSHYPDGTRVGLVSQRAIDHYDFYSSLCDTIEEAQKIKTKLETIYKGTEKNARNIF